VSTFVELYGAGLDDTLSSADRTNLFTLVKRKGYLNEGQQKFNEHTGCYVRRHPLPLVDETAEYDIEALTDAEDEPVTDFVRPAYTSASLKIEGASVTSYREGPELDVLTEEQLNQRYPNWRAASPGMPMCAYWRADGGSYYLGLYPAPDIPDDETWTLLMPYVAQPPDMTADGHEPFGAASPRTTLRPYHKAVLYYATAQLELLRKNREGHDYWMQHFAGQVAKYRSEQKPRQGQSIALAVNYRRTGMRRPPDPRRYP
jgi:hypothetical protein